MFYSVLLFEMCIEWCVRVVCHAFISYTIHIFTYICVYSIYISHRNWMFFWSRYVFLWVCCFHFSIIRNRFLHFFIIFLCFWFCLLFIYIVWLLLAQNCTASIFFHAKCIQNYHLTQFHWSIHTYMTEYLCIIHICFT